MAAEFDPYRDLLDIKSPERPPDHYALLGVAKFESDRVKVDEAAGERMALLQELANSEHMDASQRLLNEVSAARRCLLNATTKMSYDEELRARQRRSATSSSGKRGAGRGRSKRVKPVLPVGIAVAVVVILAAFWLLSKSPIVASGNLIVEWPVAERQGAAVLVDGNPVRVPESQPMYLNIPDGRHQVIFQRAGYEDIPKTFTFAGRKVRMKLVWVPKRK